MLPFKESLSETRKKSTVVNSHNVFQSLQDPNATLPKLKKQVKDSLIQKRSRDLAESHPVTFSPRQVFLTCKPGIKIRRMEKPDIQSPNKVAKFLMNSLSDTLNTFVDGEKGHQQTVQNVKIEKQYTMY